MAADIFSPWVALDVASAIPMGLLSLIFYIILFFIFF